MPPFKPTPAALDAAIGRALMAVQWLYDARAVSGEPNSGALLANRSAQARQRLVEAIDRIDMRPATVTDITPASRPAAREGGR